MSVAGKSDALCMTTAVEAAAISVKEDTRKRRQQ